MWPDSESDAGETVVKVASIFSPSVVTPALELFQVVRGTNREIQTVRTGERRTSREAS